MFFKDKGIWEFELLCDFNLCKKNCDHFAASLHSLLWEVMKMKEKRFLKDDIFFHDMKKFQKGNTIQILYGFPSQICRSL